MIHQKDRLLFLTGRNVTRINKLTNKLHSYTVLHSGMGSSDWIFFMHFQEAVSEFPNMGYRPIHAHVKARGIKCTRSLYGHGINFF